MSIQGPQFDDLLIHFLERLHDLKEDVGSLGNASFKERSKLALDEIDHNYQKLIKGSTDGISEVQLEAVTLQSVLKIDQIVQELFQNVTQSDQSTAALFQKDAARFKAHILSFQSLLRAKEEINKVGLNALLNYQWAKEEFQELVLSQNPWAMDKLRELLLADQDEAFQDLVKFMAINQESEFIEPYVEHPKLILAIQQMLKKSANDRSAALQVIGILLQKADIPWAFQVLEKKVKEISLEAMDILGQLLHGQRGSEKLYQCIVDQLIEGNPRMIEIVYQYIYQKEVEGPFMEYLMSQAIRNTELQFIILSYGILLFTSDKFQRIVRAALAQFEDPSGGYPLNRDELIDRMRQAHIDFFHNQPEDDSKGVFQGSRLPVLYQINILRLIARREHELICILTGKSSFGIDLGPPQSKCFPKTNRVIVGPLLKKDKITPLIIELADHLAQYSIPLVMPFPCRLSFPNHPSIHILPSSQNSEIWIQDLCSVQAKGVAYPALFKDENAFTRETYKARVSRVEDRLVADGEIDKGYLLFI